MRHMSEAESVSLPCGAYSTQIHANLTIGRVAATSAVGTCKGKPETL
jgi:hypothetical protein